MIKAQQIQPEMPVVCSDGGELAVVDHLAGDESIKLKKDASGRHHFIPIAWVSSVDAQVHVDRPAAQAKREWRSDVDRSLRS